MTGPGVFRPGEKGLLLAPVERQTAKIAPGPPILVVAIDTEAEFDWRGPFRRDDTSVHNLRAQALAQAIFDGFGVRPVYLVDYAVATRPEGYLPLLEFIRSGRCEIGAHLHPWITPPFTEELGERTSFSQNLPAEVQREKLAQLTDRIASSFAIRPVSYRAGRYGVGEEIADILRELGYENDLSVVPGIDMRRLHGPDFRAAFDGPYWFGCGAQLLEIPSTPCFTGVFAQAALPKGLAVEFYKCLSRPGLDRLRLRGIFARLGLLEHIPLSPEGVTFEELRRQTRARLSRGHRIFVLSYHSSSLLPGGTEYVKSPEELSCFLSRIEQYLEFFIGQLGGVSLTPSELRTALLRDAGAATANAPLAAAAR